LGRLEDFTYDSVEMANVFTEAVANVSFEGISVRTCTLLSMEKLMCFSRVV